MFTCIDCECPLTPDVKSPEDIIPANLGGTLVNLEVRCRACNHNKSNADKKLAERLQLYIFGFGVENRHTRSGGPKVRSLILEDVDGAIIKVDHATESATLVKPPPVTVSEDGDRTHYEFMIPDGPGTARRAPDYGRLDWDNIPGDARWQDVARLGGIARHPSYLLAHRVDAPRSRWSPSSVLLVQTMR